MNRPGIQYELKDGMRGLYPTPIPELIVLEEKVEGWPRLAPLDGPNLKDWKESQASIPSPVVNGKFTNGDFELNGRPASYMPAQTFNLVLDNLNNLLAFFGVSDPDPNNPSDIRPLMNTDTLLLQRLFSINPHEANTVLVRDETYHSHLRNPFQEKNDRYNSFPNDRSSYDLDKNSTQANGITLTKPYYERSEEQSGYRPVHVQVPQGSLGSAEYKSPNWNNADVYYGTDIVEADDQKYKYKYQITNTENFVYEEFARIKEDKELFKSLGYDYRAIEHLDTRLERDLGIRDGAIALRATIDSPEFTGIPRAPHPMIPTYHAETAETGGDTTAFSIKAPLDQIATVGYVHALFTMVIGTSPDTLDTIKELADAIGNNPNFITWIQAIMKSKVDWNGGVHHNAQLTGKPMCDTPNLVGY